VSCTACLWAKTPADAQRSRTVTVDGQRQRRPPRPGAAGAHRGRPETGRPREGAWPRCSCPRWRGAVPAFRGQLAQVGFVGHVPCAEPESKSKI
jgi:hypothetical protein